MQVVPSVVVVLAHTTKMQVSSFSFFFFFSFFSLFFRFLFFSFLFFSFLFFSFLSFSFLSFSFLSFPFLSFPFLFFSFLFFSFFFFPFLFFSFLSFSYFCHFTRKFALLRDYHFCLVALRAPMWCYASLMSHCWFMKLKKEKERLVFRDYYLVTVFSLTKTTRLLVFSAKSLSISWK